MLENMFFGLDARNADEGRSFMSKPGGGNRLGEQLMDTKVNIYSDPFNTELPSPTWNREGQPLEKRTWIENGVVKNLSYSRYWAGKKNVAPIPAPGNIIMSGGGASIEDMIKSTEKGILVSRLWYIRMVDPQTLLLTGLTRDGTFYIENGEIKFPVKNFRFNESPVIMLNNDGYAGQTGEEHQRGILSQLPGAPDEGEGLYFLVVVGCGVAGAETIAPKLRNQPIH